MKSTCILDGRVNYIIQKEHSRLSEPEPKNAEEREKYATNRENFSPQFFVDINADRIR